MNGRSKHNHDLLFVFWWGFIKLSVTLFSLIRCKSLFPPLSSVYNALVHSSFEGFGIFGHFLYKPWKFRCTMKWEIIFSNESTNQTFYVGFPICQTIRNFPWGIITLKSRSRTGFVTVGINQIVLFEKSCNTGWCTTGCRWLNTSSLIFNPLLFFDFFFWRMNASPLV